MNLGFGLSLFGWFGIRQTCCVVINFGLDTSGLSVLVFRVWIGLFWFCIVLLKVFCVGYIGF